MDTETEIIDAALKIYSKKGYYGARYKDIAEEAGFKEITVFRHFKTKENVFKMVIEKNHQKFFTEFNYIFKKNKFLSYNEFLIYLIKNIYEIIDSNFDYIKLTVNEREILKFDLIDEITMQISAYLKNHILNKQINFDLLALSIVSTIYFIVLNKHENNLTNPEESINKLINNTIFYTNESL